MADEKKSPVWSEENLIIRDEAVVVNFGLAVCNGLTQEEIDKIVYTEAEKEKKYSLSEQELYEKFGLKEGITKEVNLGKGIKVILTCEEAECTIKSKWRFPTPQECKEFAKNSEDYRFLVEKNDA